MSLFTFNSNGLNKFVIKISIFFTLFILLNITVVYFADGYSDEYYLRFTSSKQKSMIFGDSRSAQCLQPEIINSELNLSGDEKIYNYSFTTEISSYGLVYLNAIKNKIDTNANNSIFILSVDPWNISSWAKDPENETDFRENKNILGTSKVFNNNPNYDYLLHSFHRGWLSLFLHPARIIRDTYLHNDGWLEISIEVDSVKFEKKAQFGAKKFKNEPVIDYFSNTRIDYLEKTVKYLKKFGKVFLVRLPIHEEHKKLELEFMPSFDSIMIGISDLHNVEYFNLFEYPNNYLYLDGQHIWKESGAEVSKLVAQLIKNNNS
jgi:hypothetical protein